MRHESLPICRLTCLTRLKLAGAFFWALCQSLLVPLQLQDLEIKEISFLKGSAEAIFHPNIFPGLIRLRIESCLGGSAEGARLVAISTLR